MSVEGEEWRVRNQELGGVLRKCSCVSSFGSAQDDRGWGGELRVEVFELEIRNGGEFIDCSYKPD